jgi:threonylcarbamoyladenosine tRNA methylthiotransferase MtaB
MKYAVVTFGCRVNQADSLALERDFRARGAVCAPPAEADVVVVNTCSVTASADQGARQTIRRIVRSNPTVKVVVTGCYATRSPAEVEQLPNVVRVISNPVKETLVDLVADEIGLTTFERFGGGDGPCGAIVRPGTAGRTAFTLRVQTGCQEQCSYCIIPKTRGAGRSKPMEEVVRDIESAVVAGYKEIVLTGVHLGSYGRDLLDRSTLSALVHRLAGWPGEVLFRISSLEPMDCTPAIIEAAAESRRIAPHFHLPLQHGANGMLRAMRRPYNAAEYQHLVDRIRSRIPHASIGSDIIVGFPGETARQFDEMRLLLDDLPLTHLHVFPYSDRPGTEASRLADKVDGAITRERGAEIRALGERMARRFRESQAGTIRRALTVDDGSSAVTDNFLKVQLDRPQPRNEWIDVVIGPAEAGPPRTQHVAAGFSRT